MVLAIVCSAELRAQAATPSPGQLEAFEALERTGDWLVQWDEQTGSPATITESRLSIRAALRRPRPFSPDSVATSFVRRNTGLFPLRPGLDSLVVMQVDSPPPDARRRGGVIHVVRMSQLYGGLSVGDGGYAITMSPDGKVLFVNGRFHRGIEVDLRPTIGAEECARIAMEEVGAGADSAEHSPRLVVRRVEARDRLAWEVTVPEDPLHLWLVQVDAHDGRVINRANRVIID